MMARKAMMEAQQLKEAGDMAAFGAKMADGKKLSDDAYAKLHHDMKHFVTEATASFEYRMYKRNNERSRRCYRSSWCPRFCSSN